VAFRAFQPESEFERQLVDALSEVGIQVVPGFRVKTGDNRWFQTDIYISSPQRAVVEIKSLGLRSARMVLSQARSQMEAVRKAFEDQVICIVVLFGSEQPKDITAEEADWLEIVAAPGEDGALVAARTIRDRLFGPIPADRLAMLSSEQLADSLPGTGPLADVLVNFRTRIPDEAFQVLRLEGENFFREYASGHYTTSALCVGRMLEFVVYTLAKAWNVPISKRTIKLLEDLEGKFNALSKSIVEYAYAESASEKEKAEGILRKEVANFNASLAESTMLLHRDHEKIDTDYPINILSILRDIRKRFARIETVRKEVDVLAKGSLIADVQSMRNRAAHADTSGTRTEYDQADIDSMLENLRAILFHLGNIADAIDREPA
jgi:hypothetical protein